MPGPSAHCTLGLKVDGSSLLNLHQDLVGDQHFGFPAVYGDLCDLVAELSAAFQDERARGTRLDRHQDTTSFRRLNAHVNALLQTYSHLNNGDWRRYAAWSEHGYTRHLLVETEEFELMVLCWKAGQTSRVHNHADSHCWLTVLEGEVREVQYRPTPPDTHLVQLPGAVDIEPGAVVRACSEVKVEPTIVTDLRLGDVAYINDSIALHSVGCPAASTQMALGSIGSCDGSCPEQGSGLACTLHLYCPPIRRVKAFEEGRVVECVPGFFSRHSICGASTCQREK